MNTVPSVSPRRARWWIASLCGVLLGCWVVQTILIRPAWSSIGVGARFGGLLVPPLEHRFERTDIGDPTTLTGLVVLGGHDDRIREAGRLARQWPHLKIFVSGAGTPDYVQRLLGGDIASQRVQVETISRTTFENALNSMRFVAAAPGERWLLVTSAFHMPRSMGVFRSTGFVVEPWPVFHPTGNQPTLYHNAAKHEWLGLVWYWLLGRSQGLFPAPLPGVGASTLNAAPHL